MGHCYILVAENKGDRSCCMKMILYCWLRQMTSFVRLVIYAEDECSRMPWSLQDDVRIRV